MASDLYANESNWEWNPFLQMPLARQWIATGCHKGDQCNAALQTDEDRDCDQKLEEALIVGLCNAAVHPDAMVVKANAALVAQSAVLTGARYT
jgi:hypothetical protein